MRIILVRHPVSMANIHGIVHDDLVGGIDQKGHAQVDDLLKRLAREKIDRVYSSDAHRCRHLAEKVAAAKGVSVDYNPLFREINRGDFCGKTKTEVEDFLSCDPLTKRCPNGESLLELVARAEKGRDLIISGGGNDNLLVSHGQYLKMFLANQLGVDPVQAVKLFKFSNCAISEIRLADHGWLVEYLNNRDYLRK